MVSSHVQSSATFRMNLSCHCSRWRLSSVSDLAGIAISVGRHIETESRELDAFTGNGEDKYWDIKAEAVSFSFSDNISILSSDPSLHFSSLPYINIHTSPKHCNCLNTLKLHTNSNYMLSTVCINLTKICSKTCLAISKLPSMQKRN